MLACAGTLLAVGCGGPGDVVQIEKTRMAAVPSKTALPGVDLRSRLGRGRAQQEAAQSQQQQPDIDPSKFFAYDLPEGWESLPPTEFRIINLRSKSVPIGSCSPSGPKGGLRPPSGTLQP